MSAMLAKRMGAKKVMVLINVALVDLVQGVIDVRFHHNKQLFLRL